MNFLCHAVGSMLIVWLFLMSIFLVTSGNPPNNVSKLGNLYMDSAKQSAIWLNNKVNEITR